MCNNSLAVASVEIRFIRHVTTGSLGQQRLLLDVIASHPGNADVGCMRPTIIFSVVVLPAPLGPRSKYFTSYTETTNIITASFRVQFNR
jgi:hypothetical protein